MGLHRLNLANKQRFQQPFLEFRDDPNKVIITNSTIDMGGELVKLMAHRCKVSDQAGLGKCPTFSHHPGHPTNDQWEIQDPKMEVLYHIRLYFMGIFPYIDLTNKPYIW